MKDSAIPFTLFGLVLIILSLDKVSIVPSELELEHSDIQISFLMTLTSDRRSGEVVWTFKSLKQNWKEVTVSFISTPSKEHVALDGLDIVQLGSFMLLGHF